MCIVTALVEMLNNNSTIINAFATSVQALATMGMLAVSIFLFIAAKASAIYAEKQTDIMDKQLLIEKYRRLRDEMDNLVAPLHVHACSYDKDRFIGGNEGYFTTFKFKDRGAEDKDRIKAAKIVKFWDDVQMNSYLSGSEELSKYLLQYFEHIETYNVHSNSINRINFDDNIYNLVQSINARYKQLNKELNDIWGVVMRKA